MQVAEDVRQRERVLRPERQHQRVLGGRRLQLEVELPAEALAQRQPPRLVDAAAERRVQHQLHAAGLVEEPLEHQRVLRRDHAERAAAFGEVGDGLLGGVPARGRSPPISQSTAPRAGAGSSSRRSTSARRSLTARDSSSLRAGASPSQNGIVGGAPLRVGDADVAAGHLQDPPRRVPELEDVAGVALDREVLVERADERVVGIEDDAVVGDLGDGAAGRLREQPRAAASADRAR